ncbi:MAG: HoxN/HupN/NixA family nickel/cobalt transporter [Nostoc sp. NOS(2021)]|uniref:HoxN/HupN/NixA family nickel/cobalt transporter n=1 Tax=Nostoc sp. NOS(2021) TaxID=2815407 RepID=UPI0025F3E824|nr:HoxN/HupN/NixA family nickel/cobalt transporter [Nostoc sp. NOS(2021)]MBN3897199.1 HoxN/HupN/NixA family nickel/cobalt transporter [Nostoc sp. NOS(2021)]
MLSGFSRVFNDSSRNVRRKVINIYAFLISVNILVWVVALIAFHSYPLLLGTAVLAYSFGLRHAVDADHIAAIDNVTRKLMQENKRPVSVGFFFSLGHSTIVVLASVAIALTASTIQKDFPSFQKVGGLIGTSVSALFLLAIAAINMVVLWDVYKTFQSVKRGGTYDDQSLDEFLNQRGLLGRFFRPLFRLIDSSWKMYPLGFLFGLGFDTATEVGLLGISASQAAKGLPIWSILLFPALFTAGMSLVDTTDGILMLGAYGWAYVKPIRKLYYNMTITFVSVLVAVIIGGIEALSIIGDQLELKGWFWDFISNLSDNFGTIGYLIIGIFVLSWLLSTFIYKVKKYDELEVTTTTTPKQTRD